MLGWKATGIQQAVIITGTRATGLVRLTVAPVWVVPRYETGRYYGGYWQGPRGRFEHSHKWDHDHDRDRGRCTTTITTTTASTKAGDKDKDHHDHDRG